MALKKETEKATLSDKIALLGIAVNTLIAGEASNNELETSNMNAANKVMAKVWPDIKAALGIDNA